MKFLLVTTALLSSTYLAAAEDRKLVAFPPYNPGECLVAFFKADGTSTHKIVKVEDVSNASEAKKGEAPCDNTLKKSFGDESGLCYVFCNPNQTPNPTPSE